MNVAQQTSPPKKYQAARNLPTPVQPGSLRELRESPIIFNQKVVSIAETELAQKKQNEILVFLASLEKNMKR